MLFCLFLVWRAPTLQEYFSHVYHELNLVGNDRERGKTPSEMVVGGGGSSKCVVIKKQALNSVKGYHFTRVTEWSSLHIISYSSEESKAFFHSFLAQVPREREWSRHVWASRGGSI